MFRDLPLALNAAIFIGAAAAVWWAGTKLAYLADAIAERTGITRAFLGMMLLGGVTSLPEIAVALTATWQGTPVLTVNDVLGSAAANLVVLAVADAVFGRSALTSVQGSAQVMLQGVLGMVVLALAIAPVAVGDVLVLGAGVWSWLMLAVYLGSIRLLAKSRAHHVWTSKRHPSLEKPGAKREITDARSSAALVLRTIGVAAIILVAGFFLTTSADALADQSGLGASFFAMVFLAISTSLPEVSTVLAAVRLRRYEMAIGDVFGTNLVNVTILFLVDALHPGGPVLLEVGKSATVGALMALFLTGIFLIGLLERRDRTLLRMGVDSIAVLVVYCAGLTLLYFLR